MNPHRIYVTSEQYNLYLEGAMLMYGPNCSGWPKDVYEAFKRLTVNKAYANPVKTDIVGLCKTMAEIEVLLT